MDPSRRIGLGRRVQLGNRDAPRWPLWLREQECSRLVTWPIRSQGRLRYDPAAGRRAGPRPMRQAPGCVDRAAHANGQRGRLEGTSGSARRRSPVTADPVVGDVERPRFRLQGQLPSTLTHSRIQTHRARHSNHNRSCHEHVDQPARQPQQMHLMRRRWWSAADAPALRPSCAVASGYGSGRPSASERGVGRRLRPARK
jgi:hypothetical protein